MLISLIGPPYPLTKVCDTLSEVTKKLRTAIFLSIKVWYGVKATVYVQCFCRRSRKTGSDKEKKKAN